MLGGEFDAGAIGKYIFGSIKADKPLQFNPGDYNKLKNTINKIASVPGFKSEQINGTVIKKLNKKTIIFEKHISEIDSLQFDFMSKQKGNVVFYKNGLIEKYPFAVSTNAYALSFDPTLQLPVAFQVSYKDDEEFILHFNQLCRINNFYFHFVIKDNEVTTMMEETSNFIKTNIVTTFK
jgi:hypothetical protein